MGPRPWAQGPHGGSGLRGHTEGGGADSEAVVFPVFSVKGYCVAGSGVSVLPGEACGCEPERQDLLDTSPRSHCALGFGVPSGPSGTGFQGTWSALLAMSRVPPRPIPPGASPGHVDASVCALNPNVVDLCVQHLSVSSWGTCASVLHTPPFCSHFALITISKALSPNGHGGQGSPCDFGDTVQPLVALSTSLPSEHAMSPRLCTDREGLRRDVDVGESAAF